MIGPYDVTLSGRGNGFLFFRLKNGDKRGLKDTLPKKELAMELKIGGEDAKVFREETWLQAADLKEWTADEIRRFWSD